MKILPLILIILLSLRVSAQEPSVRIITQDTWPPGKNVPVTIEITRGEASGFARFYNDLPQGFTAENVVSSGADFFWDNSQVNYVWLDLPGKELIIIQYLARADESLAGSFKLSGRLDFIADGKTRVSISSAPLSVKLDRSASVETVDVPDDIIADPGPGKNSYQDPDHAGQKAGEEKPVKEVIPRIDFRVQVSISSQRFSQAELEDRIGSKLQHGIVVLSSGNMFKYHSGSFKNYGEAAVYLDELKVNGVSDAFIVAFEEGKQISINKAREQTEK